MRRNPLYAKPPRAVHSRGAVSEPASSFAYVTGRSIRPEDWDGVHVTQIFELAQTYASSAADRHDCAGVIFGIDIRGYDVLPDIDGIAHLGEYLLVNREDYADLLRSGASPAEADEALSMGDFDPLEYDDPHSIIHRELGRYEGIWAYFESAFRDKRQALDELHAFLQTGSIPNEVIIEGSRIARIMDDVDLDSIASVSVVRPWFNKLAMDWDDWQCQRAAQECKTCVTLDDVGHFLWPCEAIAHVVFHRVPVQYVWWHGTSEKFAAMVLGDAWERWIEPVPALCDPHDPDAERHLGGNIVHGMAVGSHRPRAFKANRRTEGLPGPGGQDQLFEVVVRARGSRYIRSFHTARGLAQFYNAVRRIGYDPYDCDVYHVRDRHEARDGRMHLISTYVFPPK